MQISTSDAYHAVIRWQARREHSALELKEKLARYGASQDIIVEVLTKVRDKDLQSDARFAECLTRSRLSQGYGAVRIRQLLMQKGIDESLLSETLVAYSEGTDELAFKVLAKKYKMLDPADEPRGVADSWGVADERGVSEGVSFETLAKMKRFLQYRGFTHEDINAAVSLYKERVLNVSS